MVPATALSTVIGDVTVYAATAEGPQWVSGQDVVVEDGRIIAIGPGAADPARDSPRVDGSGGHLIPGFVNTHTHLQQSILRGAGRGCRCSNGCTA